MYIFGHNFSTEQTNQSKLFLNKYGHLLNNLIYRLVCIIKTKVRHPLQKIKSEKEKKTIIGNISEI